MIYNFSKELARSAITCFVPCDTGVSSGADIDNIVLNTKRRSTANIYLENLLDGRNEQKCLLYMRSIETHSKQIDSNYLSENICEGKNVFIKSYITTMNTFPFTYTEVVFYKAWPSISPTVNSSWFIAKAYLTNLYYTTQRDVSLTIQICDDIIHVYRQSRMN